MSQEQLLILLFKIVLVADLAALASFVILYTKLAPWWRNPIGRTIVIKDLLLGAAFTPTVLSLFLHFNRLTSQIAGWVDLALFAGIAGVMVWRDIVWYRIHHGKKTAGEPEGEPPPDAVRDGDVQGASAEEGT